MKKRFILRNKIGEIIRICLAAFTYILGKSDNVVPLLPCVSPMEIFNLFQQEVIIVLCNAAFFHIIHHKKLSLQFFSMRGYTVNGEHQLSSQFRLQN